MERFKCRVCRQVLFDSSALVSCHGQAMDGEECPTEPEVYYIDDNALPEWMKSCVDEGNGTKGRLACTRCHSPLGKFNYVTPHKCPCGDHAVPRVQISKSRVDRERPQPSIHIRDAMREPSASAAADIDGENPERGAALADISQMAAGTRASTTSDEAVPAGLQGSHGLQPDTSGARNSPSPPGPPTLHPNHSGQPDNNVIVGSCNHRKCAEPPASATDPINPPKTLHLGYSSDSDLDYFSQIEQAHPLNSTTTTIATAATTSTMEIANGGGPKGRSSNRQQQQLRKRMVTSRKKLRRKMKESQNRRGLLITEDSAGPDSESEEEDDEEEVEIAIPDCYICPICLDVLYKPHTCSPCRHVFCDPCLRQLARGKNQLTTLCPICRAVIRSVKSNQELQDEIRLLFPQEFLLRKRDERKRTSSSFPLPGGGGGEADILDGYWAYIKRQWRERVARNAPPSPSRPPYFSDDSLGGLHAQVTVGLERYVEYSKIVTTWVVCGAAFLLLIWIFMYFSRNSVY